MSDMTTTLAMIGDVDNRRLFQAVLAGWENGFVRAVDFSSSLNDEAASRDRDLAARRQETG
jgi:hypothetical protein